MDRIKKNALRDLRVYGESAMRYHKTGHPLSAKINRTRLLVIIDVLRAR